MPIATYRLTDLNDPEERLEDAALWKAMFDEYGKEIRLVEEPSENLPLFGRHRLNEVNSKCSVSSSIHYWQDAAFLNNCGRSFKVCDFDDAEKEVERLHNMGKGAFLKSTRMKHSIIKIDVGMSFYQGMDAMAYSFIDAGPKLMVQELCEITNEHRFFVIDRQIVTQSPVQYQLTPLDHPLPDGATYLTPTTLQMDVDHALVEQLTQLAEYVAMKMDRPHASIDCALINGQPAIVEFNPMALGNLGLYSCDVRALARASRKLVPEQAPLRTIRYTIEGEDRKAPEAVWFR